MSKKDNFKPAKICAFSRKCIIAGNLSKMVIPLYTKIENNSNILLWYFSEILLWTYKKHTKAPKIKWGKKLLKIGVVNNEIMSKYLPLLKLLSSTIIIIGIINEIASSIVIVQPGGMNLCKSGRIKISFKKLPLSGTEVVYQKVL